MYDTEPTDNEVHLVLAIQKIAEALPLDTTLRLLLTVIALLVKGSGHANAIWPQIAAAVESQRRWPGDDRATHETPDRMQ